MNRIAFIFIFIALTFNSKAQDCFSLLKDSIIIYASENNYKKLEPFVNKALKCKNNSSEIVGEMCFLKGKIAFNKEHYYKALKLFTKTTTLIENDLESYLYKARCNNNLEDYYNGYLDGEKAIKIDSTSFSSYYNFAVSCMGLNKNSLAVESILKALKIDSLNIDGWILLGDIASKSEARPFSIKAYTEALKINPLDANLYYKRGLEYYNIDDKDNAIEDFSNSLFFKPTSTVYMCRGAVLYADKRYNKALEDFSNAIALDTYNGIAYYNRAACYQALGKEAEYKKDLKIAYQLGYGETFSF